MKLSRSVDKVLQEADSELATLVTRTRKLQALTLTFRQVLDPELASHCYVGNIENDCLTVLVDSAAWASKLRFSSHSILHNLNQLNHMLSRINKLEVKIVNQRIEQPAPAYQKPQMNQENAKGLITLAESIDDNGLQAALTRLAQKAKPES